MVYQKYSLGDINDPLKTKTVSTYVIMMCISSPRIPLLTENGACADSQMLLNIHGRPANPFLEY